MSSKKSTIVRTQDGAVAAPAAWRLGLRALEALSPSLAARAGERLFLTPLRHRAPARESEALRRAHAFDVPFRGGRLRAWSFGEGPAVLLVHGWSGRGGQMAAFAPRLAASGLRAVTFDAPAHGRSSGSTASILSFAQALRAVASHVGGARAAVAHSMGAPSLVKAMLDGLALDALVFVGPPRSPVEPFRRFGDAFGLSPRLRDGIRARLEARFGLPLADFDLPRLSAAFDAPLLVVHDRADAEVAWEEGAAVAAGWPRARLWTTEGLGHSRILRAPAVVEQAAEFVAAHVRGASCACGGWPAARAGRSRVARCATCALADELFDPSTRWVVAAA